MSKKGFTLVELLGALIILSVIFLISIPVIMSYINEVRASVYRQKEEDLEETVKKFVVLNDSYIPKQVGNTIYVTMDLLITNEVMNSIINTKTNTDCDGYVILRRTTETKVEYEPFIDCGEPYKTNGYIDLVGLDPTIDIIGNIYIEHQIHTPYVEQGANAFDPINNDIKDMIIVHNHVNINVAGTYTVIYEVDKGTLSPITATRTVVVKDMIPPVIVLNGDPIINHPAGSVYNDLGAVATDNIDGDITSNITITSNLLHDVISTYTSTYTIVDSSGNEASVSRTINVVDSTPPSVVFSINGNTTYAMNYNPIVTVSDNVSVNAGSLKYQWTTSTATPGEGSFVNTFTNGSNITTPSSVTGGYYLWILAKDSIGNTAIVRSNVFNLDNTNPSVSFGTNGNATYATSYSTTVTVSDNISVNASSLKYLWNKSTTAPSEGSFVTTFTNGGTITTPANSFGSHYLWILAKDTAGNTIITRSNAFNLQVVTVYYLNGTYTNSLGTPTRHGQSGMYLQVNATNIRTYNTNDLYVFGGFYWSTAIDLTDVAIVRFRAYSSTSATDYSGQVRSVSTGAVAASTPIAYHSSATDYDLNVSSLSGMHYIYTDGYPRTQSRYVTGLTTIKR